ncbi:hypothetical protein EAF04_009946 [Stromatinia cepivora]|nr:hypothetical protein EAF04_009946 [Stromatinia cepivora]
MADLDAIGPNLETAGGETVDVYIGKWDTPFEIDKTVLLDKVPFFRRVFRRFGPYVVVRQARYRKGDPESFSILLNWLCTDELPVLTAKFDKGDKEVTYSGYQPDKLYYLVAKFELFNLANHIMDCLIPCHRDLGAGFSKDQIMSVYKQDVNDGIHFYGLRKFVSMWLHYEWSNPRCLHRLTTNAEYESLRQVPAILHDLGYLESGHERTCPWHLLTCSLHKHDSNNLCAGQKYTFETVEPSYCETSVYTLLK